MLRRGDAALLAETTTPPAKRTKSDTESLPIDDESEGMARDIERPPTLDIPVGIRLILIGGIRGVGTKTCTELLGTILRQNGLACRSIDANSFLEAAPEWCPTCLKQLDALQGEGLIMNFRCMHGPMCLDTATLYKHVYDVAAELADTRDYANGGDAGVLIIFGTHVLSCIELQKHGDTTSFFLFHDNQDVCIARALRVEGKIPLAVAATSDPLMLQADLVHLKEADNFAIQREYAHYTDQEYPQSEAARHPINITRVDAPSLAQEVLQWVQTDWPGLYLPHGPLWTVKQSAKAGASPKVAPVSQSLPTQVGTIPKAEQDEPMAPSLPTQVETTPKAEQNVPMPDAAETEPTLPPLPAQAGTGQAVPEVIGLQFGPQWSDTVARARAARGLPPTEVVAAALLASTAASQPEPAEPSSAAAAAPAQCKPCGSTDVRMKTGVFVDPSAAAPVGTLAAQAAASSGAPPWRSSAAQAAAAPAAPAVSTKKADLRPRAADAPQIENPPPGTTFHSRVPRSLLKTSRAVGKNYDNIFRPPWMYDKYSRAMTRVLRHDPRLNVDGHGFAYCEDILRALGNKEIYHLTASEFPRRADLIHVVNTQEKGRYEATALTGDGAPFDLLIRCVQAHSGQVAAQLNRDLAFTRVTNLSQIPYLTHHTKSELLGSILGNFKSSAGLLPGGTGRDSQNNWRGRNDIHMSLSPPSKDGSIPDKFRKRGIDCAIALDNKALFAEADHLGVVIYISANNVALCDAPIPYCYIRRISMLADPRLTLFTQPSEDAWRARPGLPKCLMCGLTWNYGCNYCFQCWEPMTIPGLIDRLGYLRDLTERRRELNLRYNLTTQDLDQMSRQPGATLIGLPSRLPIVGAAGPIFKRAAALQPKTTTPALAAVAAKWSSGAPWRQDSDASSARASGAAASSARASGAGPELGAASKARPAWVPKAKPGARPSRRPADSPCAHMTAVDVRKLQLQAVKRHFLSHTDRYDKEESYRRNCDEKMPHATPRLLQFPSGEWANTLGPNAVL